MDVLMSLLCIINMAYLVSGMSSDTSRPTRTLASYNAGLTSKIPHIKERSQYIKEKLKTLDLDVVCLQEYWYVADTRDLVQTVQDQYPHSFSAVHETSSQLTVRNRWSLFTGPCLRFAVLKMFFLMWWHGCMKAKDQSAMVKCAVEKAGAMNLPQECITCITMSGMSRVLSYCVGPNSGGMNIPALVLLSKHPLRNSRKVDYLPGVKQLVPRSYLYSEVDGIGPIACTHTTANLGNVYYEPNLLTQFKSWADQNLNDAKILVNALHQLPKAIIIGDLNCGPTVERNNVNGDFTASFQYFIRNNYTAPFVDLVGKCTFCGENPLVPYTKGWNLDHVLLRGFDAVEAKRIFDTFVPGENYPPSDHYGVQVTIETES